MPASNFNVGRDCQVVIQHPMATGPGNRLDLSIVTDFDPKQNVVEASVDGLDGKFRSASLPKSWSGTIGIDRANNACDLFITALENAYYNGRNVPPGSVYQYITETDESVTRYQFDQCSFHLPMAGSWKNDTVVKMQLGFIAARRRVV